MDNDYGTEAEHLEEIDNVIMERRCRSCDGPIREWNDKCSWCGREDSDDE